MKQNNEQLTNSCNSRTFIIDIFCADLAHHLGGDSLEGVTQRESQSRKQNAADEKRRELGARSVNSRQCERPTQPAGYVGRSSGRACRCRHKWESSLQGKPIVLSGWDNCACNVTNMRDAFHTIQLRNQAGLQGVLAPGDVALRYRGAQVHPAGSRRERH